MDLGHGCTSSEACTLPNIYCRWPYCALAKKKAARTGEYTFGANPPPQIDDYEANWS